MKQYYICKPDGTQEGPYPEAMIQACIAQGLYPPGTLVWCEGMNEWIPIHEPFQENTWEEDVTSESQSKKSTMKSTALIIIVIMITLMHFHSRTNKLLLDNDIEQSNVQRLCDLGADINTRDKYGRTPLLKLAKKIFKNRKKTVLMESDDWSAIQCYISEGADILAQDNKGNGILHYLFIEEISRSIKQSTLEYHNRLDARLASFHDLHGTKWYDELFTELAPALMLQNNRGETPFMTLWKKDATSIYERSFFHALHPLMKEEMVHITDKQGNTHLMLDVQRRMCTFMYDFIEAGADVSAVNKKGQTALDIYKQYIPKKNQEHRIIRLLQYGKADL